MSKAVKKFNEITSGWINLKFPSPEIEEMAKKRAKICSKCPEAVPGTWLQAIVGDDQIKEISGLKCRLCNCPLSAKDRSPDSSCPIDKW